MGKSVTSYIVVLCSLLQSLVVFSQEQQNVPPLERNISIEFRGSTVKEALKNMEAVGNFSFAYKTDIISASDRMTRMYLDRTTREILDDIFQGSLTYKGKGTYIILRKSPKLKDQEINLEGYVMDNVTGEKIAFATIYDTASLSSSVSDEYGHYSLNIMKKELVYLNVRKAGYVDSVFLCNASGNDVLNIYIDPVEKSEETYSTVDSSSLFDKLKNMKLFSLSDKQKANLLNFKNPLSRRAQFSVLPTIGTNGKLSASTEVDYSLNLFGGINAGVRVMEIGALFNIDMDTVEYFQAAGLFNTVGGPQQGVQLGGIANLNNNSFSGTQVGGILNVVRNDFEGAQLAGITNFTLGKQTGFQGAGICNFNVDTTEAVQVAGIANYASKSSSGTQISGFTNYAAKGYAGVQVAGFNNYSGKNTEGVQVAGFTNFAGNNFEGVQVSGFINVAQTMKGVQVGFINVNDSIDGLSIGFLSISRKGYHVLEIAANEIFSVQAAFKTGTHQFYNSFVAGTRLDNSTDPIVGVGYGLGTSVKLAKRSRLFFDFQTTGLSSGGNYQFNLLNKFILSYHFQAKKMFAVAFGPSFNVYTVGEASTPNGARMKRIAPYSFSNTTSAADQNQQMWVGAQVSIQLF